MNLRHLFRSLLARPFLASFLPLISLLFLPFSDSISPRRKIGARCSLLPARYDLFSSAPCFAQLSPKSLKNTPLPLNP